MSLITESLPHSVEYKGESYEIKTDFRDWLRFYESAAKGNLTGMLSIYRRLPPSVLAAAELAVRFGNGGALKYKGNEGRKALIDYSLDAPLIYAAFMGEYGIDLCEADLHWYKFCALLSGLGEERRLCRIIAIRAAEPSSIADPKRRSEIRRLQRIYACPDNRSAEERDRDISEALGGFY